MLPRLLPIGCLAIAVAGFSQSALGGESSAAASPSTETALTRLLGSSCLECHDESSKSADLDFTALMAEDVEPQAATWEKVVRKLTSRQMPPPEASRPTEREYDAAISWLESALDEAAARSPNPGRGETFRRLTRVEYRNTIRDLLALEIDVASMLPADESSHGFDNVTVADLSPTLLNRYLAAAQKISRLAVGSAPRAPEGHTVRMRPDVTQDSHVEGLPLGTRGGLLIPYTFPQDGEYEIQIHLMRDRNDDIESLFEPHELEVLIDRARVDMFTVRPPTEGENHQSVDANLKSRVQVAAGPHQVGVTFVNKFSSLEESTRQPLNVHFNFYRHPRLGPAVFEVSIVGPFQSQGSGDTPSRRKIFIEYPQDDTDKDACAERIIAKLTRQAYRRPITEADLKRPLDFYRQAREEQGFEAGIEAALTSILISPHFLFRIEHDPPGIGPRTAYRLSGPELASRLSYFAWSSMPDDELLDLAESGELATREVLEDQVMRMLADKRSRSLVDNFAAQWLYLRNIDSVTPDMRLFPDFDDNLRQAMRQETEHFFQSIVREDRTVLDLLCTNSTYLNERLAKHYGVPHVYGSRFRRVALDENTHRGGLLRHGSILAVTSYATRTSPVIRGQWVLNNIVGTPAPPPPPNVPTLDDNTVSSSLPIRERLAQHRANAACAACHDRLDPVGFSLENFDAVGRWRETESGQPVDASGGLPDGSEFAGVSGLEKGLRERPELFVRTLTEKLMTFALGRGAEYSDAPAIRKIVRDARGDNYRFSRLIVGIVQSTPFQMRMSP